MKRSLVIAATLLLAGCGDISDMTCADIADEAIDITDSTLIKLSHIRMDSRTDKEIVCHGTGVYHTGDDIPTRFRTHIDDDGDRMTKYDISEYRAEAEAKAIRVVNEQADRENKQAQRELEQAEWNAGIH